MKLLGIDFGSKKIGLAASDQSGNMAFPKEVIPNDGNLLSHIKNLVEKEGISEIIIGQSIDYYGKNNKIQDKINEFIVNLTLQINVPVHLQDERYSTQAALQIQGRNSQTDASAAALILDSFIRLRKNKFKKE